MVSISQHGFGNRAVLVFTGSKSKEQEKVGNVSLKRSWQILEETRIQDPVHLWAEETSKTVNSTTGRCPRSCVTET